jgi:hypothetical protein
VEIIDGLQAGTVTTTDEAGRFSMPGTITGTVAVTASKDGYISETRTVPPSVPPNRPVPPAPGELRHWSSFSLQPLGPSADIAGVYTLTLTVDRACTDLSDEARTRSYTATIVLGHRPTAFVGRLSNAQIIFSLFSPLFEIGTAGDFANMFIRFVEKLGAASYLAVEGGAGASFGPSGMTAPFGGYSLHCPHEASWAPGEYWWCGAGVQGTECNSSKHQIQLVRR